MVHISYHRALKSYNARIYKLPKVKNETLEQFKVKLCEEVCKVSYPHGIRQLPPIAARETTAVA
jgi:hypothetical protein